MVSESRQAVESCLDQLQFANCIEANEDLATEKETKDKGKQSENVELDLCDFNIYTVRRQRSFLCHVDCVLHRENNEQLGDAVSEALSQVQLMLFNLLFSQASIERRPCQTLESA